jgi:ketosteroid isomerase-like protein
MGPTGAQQRNLELATRFLAILNDRGIAGVERDIETLTHPEVEWVPGMLMFDTPSYKGREQLKGFIHDALATKEGSKSYINVDELRPVGEDGVLALGWVHYADRDGRPFDGEYALLVRVADDRLRFIQSFASHRAAERAVADA